MTLEEPQQQNKERAEKIKVYFNDEEMAQVTIRSEEFDKDDLPIMYTVTYPNTLKKDPFIDKNNITQVKMHETPHFLEIAIFNHKDEMINVEKIFYGTIFRVNMASKKAIPISIRDTSESEITGLR